VLADWLCGDDFPEKSRDLLKFDYRKSRLLKVVLENSPDVIAIEECDHFSDWFQPELAKSGYDGAFQAKSDKDGTAIFWSTKVFKRTNYKYHRYGSDSQGVVLLELTNTGNDQSGIYVAATHLKAKGGFEERRKNQVDMLVDEFSKFVQHKTWPCFVLGDFNDVPSSLAIQQLQKVYTSAYDNSIPNYWTTWKKREKEVKRIIDYIFYDPARVILTKILAVPQNCPTHLPDTFYPSDHLSLCAQFSYE